MKLLQLLARRGALLGLAVVLFIALVYLFFPADRVDTLIGRQLAEQGLKLAPTARKTLLPGLSWRGATLSSDAGVLLRGDRLTVRPLLLPLLTGKVVLRTALTLGNGWLQADSGLNGREALSLQADGIKLADMPFFKTVLGASAGGALWCEGRVRRDKGRMSGEIKLEVRQLEFSGVTVGGMPLPNAANLRSQGMIRITDGKVRLESFTLQGDGVYMRLSGDLPDGANAAAQPLNLVLEIMPKPEFMEQQKLVFLLLAKFTATPGVYRIPIKGTLLKPSII